ncbi:MAG: cytochrome C [Lysobacterales bacterium CG17_big_fil_post_rev_8_21_14_2_50_64_11]|nr:MAG: cytochrome C [Xanthomonadales bacterium CG17_big_fil_post_rev_8_21_14_2_50_64_11]PIX59346.1 MAG: cytochrome C [Xanthomonadales bacterium CG_4_10_14_3_um_filter_64_11]
MTRLFAVLLLISFAHSSLAADPEVPYPEGYRAWHHVKSMVIEDGHPLFAAFGGIHHLYANAKAVQGYRSGSFPDGAVIVFDLLEAHAADNAITEGARKVVGVMHKDAKAYPTTGGWGFEGFAGGAPSTRAVGSNAATACFACHAPQQAQGYVFSTLRD